MLSNKTKQTLTDNFFHSDEHLGNIVNYREVKDWKKLGLLVGKWIFMKKSTKITRGYTTFDHCFHFLPFFGLDVS